MNHAHKELLDIIENKLKEINYNRGVAAKFAGASDTVDLLDKLIVEVEKIEKVIQKVKLSGNYLNEFKKQFEEASPYLPYKDEIDNNTLNSLQVEQIKAHLKTQDLTVQKKLDHFRFNYDFFNKLGFFNDNIVVVGANGSGKTALSYKFKEYLSHTGVVISAQKILLIPTFSSISNILNTSQILKQTQVAEKSLRTTYPTENRGNAYNILAQLGGEFHTLLDNLLAERSAIRNKFVNTLQGDIKNIKVPKTRLDRALEIWNSLITHRVIACEDGINITLSGIGIEPYPAYQMSDGEKVVLFLIAQVLQAPTTGFIIIDEPEMYLHKTILDKLYDMLEKERQDCIFIYLTHDLDFAVSRATAKKVWIKTYTHPDQWNFEEIPENELPEGLLLELLGSRKNILFCEGQKGSIDEKVYNILFPDLTIRAVKGCLDVINYTKAFNKIPGNKIKAFGIVDADHHNPIRLASLKSENIFSFSMAEAENLFLSEEFLKMLAPKVLSDQEQVPVIKKEVLALLNKDMEMQISHYLSAKINYYFNDSHMSKGNTVSELSINYKKFTDEIMIQEWYNERKTFLEKIIRDGDYEKALSIFNNKGLQAIANRYLNITNFIERSVKLLQFEPDTHKILLKYFPEEVKYADKKG